MKVDEHGLGDGIEGVSGAVDFRVAIFMAKVFIARVSGRVRAPGRISGSTLQLGRMGVLKKAR
jgi:hypothetical protein